jgi:LysM repeat protein
MKVTIRPFSSLSVGRGTGLERISAAPSHLMLDRRAFTAIPSGGSMEKIKVRPGDTLAKIGLRFRVSTADIIKANPTIKNPDLIHPGQMINLPVPARHSDGGQPAGVPGSGTAGDPAQDPKYIENAVVAVGLPIWGGPFYLYRSVVGGRGVDALVLPRNEVSLDFDPLRASYFELRSVYPSKPEAETAAASYKMPGAYSYYKTGDGILYPTILSETTAPRLCKALRQAVVDEKAAAKAASNLAVNLLLWYIGARIPITAGETSGAAAAADAALTGFSAVEQGIIVEVRAMMKASEMAKLREAFAAGKDVIVKIGGRTIQYEPGLNASGMTMFGENGFLLGKQAFTSEAELIKTLLHETYRLNTSISQTAGVSAATAAMETQAAFNFAEKAYQAVLAGLR